MDLAENRINTTILRDIYQKSTRFRLILDYLSERQRNYRETKPEILILRLRERSLEFDRNELIRFFRELERAGCGRYVEGRRGHGSRFEWHARMSDVGLAARGEQDEIGELEERPSDTEELAERNKESDTITHSFYLRSNFSIELRLPSDLRDSEAERVSDWVKTLPFKE